MADPWPPSVRAGRVLESPVGSLTVVASATGIAGLRFGPHPIPEEPRVRIPASVRTATGLIEQAARQLDEYFTSGRTAFDLPLDLQGTPFQLQVWEALRRIPYGRTLTYGELAMRLGDLKLARAVGAAAGANPVGILVPCHRLVGSDGSLVGFAAGVAVKAALLRLEAQLVQPDLFGGP